MKKSDFYFDLPSELIAQKPLNKRDESRLLFLNKKNVEIKNDYFFNILDYFEKGDTIILNNSKVIPARIYGKKVDTGAHVEFLLLKEIEKDTWEVLVKPGKKAKISTSFIFLENKLTGDILDVLDDGKRLLKFNYQGNFYEILDEIGEMPLPPYIKEKLVNKNRYQTVYANELGSAAAPTAGLHFTEDILKKLRDKSINIGFVTLHVGLGTFRPVKESLLKNHKMHTENFYIGEDTVDLIKKTKLNNKKVYAVGTTSCRVLEGVYKKHSKLLSCYDETDIFIYPPYKFNVIDGLITNFHLSESSLIMLVSAFAGYDNIMSSYKHAISEKYRFFSFGDAMLIK
ncbi:MAG: tRNA preQ1(34) S-adenosylmethionine ribosyltransferase-isomerase QueA [Oscillospiraceae bacterium]